MKNIISDIFKNTMKTIELTHVNCVEEIEKIAANIINVYKNKGKVLIFGNGGSAADSQHFAAELVGRFQKERRSYPAIALTTNTSTITALANDYSYAYIFARQIEALGTDKDLAIGISTSGQAKNVINGLKKAKDLGMQTIALTGQKGKNLKNLVDICLCVPDGDTPRIQEAHITIIHIICKLVEDNLS
ncbi:MAG: D-sedoheptulose 7-phosphate isomerase [Candidatus Omnitrophota bacterium]